MSAIFDEICYFSSVSVDIRPLPGAWVADLLGVILGPGLIGKISSILDMGKRLNPFSRREKVM